MATVCIFILPDEPLTTKWLTPEQRQLAHDRIQRDTVGLESSRGVKAGFMQALRDPRLYLLVFMQNMHLSATSFNQVCLVDGQCCRVTLLTISLVLSHRRLIARLQHHHHPCAHCTPIINGGRGGYLCGYLIREVK